MTLDPQDPPHAPPAAGALVRGWHRVECWLAFAAFTFIAVMAIYDVVARELLGPALALVGLKPGLLVI